MSQDIRDAAYIDHQDVVGLNFINADGKYVFRRHFRQGLRSHIMEILDPADIEKEVSGEVIDGSRHFPKARPKKILRIFRTRFTRPEEALEEIRRVKLIEYFLTSDFMARSIEMIVEYRGPQSTGPLLCGIQEYVPGVILDPWSLLKGPTLLATLYDSFSAFTSNPPETRDAWLKSVRESAEQFVLRVRNLILEGKHVPDLAGIGNVLINPSGQLKLVDINNISSAVQGDTVAVDDRNYPVCDKSIEALSLIEEKLLDRITIPADPLYGFFLTEERRKKVKIIESRFIAQLGAADKLP